MKLGNALNAKKSENEIDAHYMHHPHYKLKIYIQSIDENKKLMEEALRHKIMHNQNDGLFWDRMIMNHGSLMFNKKHEVLGFKGLSNLYEKLSQNSEEKIHFPFDILEYAPALRNNKEFKDVIVDFILDGAYDKENCIRKVEHSIQNNPKYRELIRKAIKEFGPEVVLSPYKFFY